MAKQQNEYIQWLGVVLNAMYKDRFMIVILTVILTVLGAAAGKLTITATSTASLLLTPLALQQQDSEDKSADSLTKMLAEPMDVTTVSLICKSDETLSTVMQQLNESGVLESPIDDLIKLKNAMEFTITVSKDTPYVTEYSPVVQLAVQWGDAKEAKSIVDTWAEVCVERAERYRSLQQAPAANAFEEQRASMRTALDEAEENLETFYKANNIDLVEKRIDHLIALTTDYLKRMHDTETNLAANRAMAQAMKDSLSGEEATRKLKWQPSGKLLGLVDLPKGDAEDAETPTALNQEVINSVYNFMRERLAMADSSVAEFEATLLQISKALETYDAELKTLQEQKAQLKRTEARLLREVGILESAYKDAALKDSYAIMASNLDQPALHVLSKGAEWRLPRFRRAILFGVSAGIFGFGMAAGLSLVLRLLIQPALKQAA